MFILLTLIFLRDALEKGDHALIGAAPFMLFIGVMRVHSRIGTPMLYIDLCMYIGV